MEANVSNYLHMETSQPKHRLVRSSSALYLLLLLGTFGSIALSSWLSARFGASRLLFQILLYLGMIGAGYLIYRTFLVSYRYTLTTEELIVDQLVGGRQKHLITIPFKSIIRVSSPERIEHVGFENAYLGKRTDALMIVYEQEQKTRTLLISATETLKNILTEQIYGE